MRSKVSGRRGGYCWPEGVAATVCPAGMAASSTGWVTSSLEVILCTVLHNVMHKTLPLPKSARPLLTDPWISATKEVQYSRYLG